MRETVRSITAYLIVVGILGSLSQLGVALAPDAYWIDRSIAISGLGVTGAYIVTGVRFRHFVAVRSPIPQRILLVGAAYSLGVSLLIVVLHAISGTPLSSDQEGVTQIGRCAFGILITLYLWRNVRRIISEQVVSSPA